MGVPRMQRRPNGSFLAIAVAFMVIGASCGSAPASPAGSTTPSGASQPSSDPSASPIAGIELTEFAESADLAAPARRELKINDELRNDAGMAALIGSTGIDGAAAFTTLDGLTSEYGRQLIAEIAAAIDSGAILRGTAGGRLAGQVASVDGGAQPITVDPSAIDVSLFADTGFTGSASLTMLVGIIERAAETRNGTLPKVESFDQTDANGLRHQVDLNTSITIRTGTGKVTADVIMAATDRISNEATGSFIALYTSRTTGHFDLDACPNEQGIAAGTYTFETRHELNDVGGAAAVRSVAGRSVSAPFQVINGDDARLVRIEADLNLAADAQGPGTPGGPGPTGAFDWTANLPVHISMPRNGGTTASVGDGAIVTGPGSQNASGAMLLTQGMAMIFLGQVGTEAETFWRSGECIELTPSRDAGPVQPNEEIELEVKAREKFGDRSQIEKPMVATFTGTKSLETTGSPVGPPAKFKFKAGAVKDDRGTIDLLQTSNRGIGKRQVVYTVGEPDYKIEHRVGGNSYTATKCDGHVGEWTINVEAADPMGRAIGTYKFTFAREGGAAAVRGILDATAQIGSVHWNLRGSVSFVPATDVARPSLNFTELTGTATIKAAGITKSVPTKQAPTKVELLVGDFCQ